MAKHIIIYHFQQKHFKIAKFLNIIPYVENEVTAASLQPTFYQKWPEGVNFSFMFNDFNQETILSCFFYNN